MSDICLVLEGTWPAITGGVSTWTQQLLEGLDDDVTVVHLHTGDAPVARAFEPPACVRSIVEVELDPDRPDVDRAAVDALPDARLYHALSSAWSGAIAARAATARRTPFLLTEHGIAWREARTWTTELETGRGPIAGRDWAATIDDLARTAYTAADHVTTVCHANAALQRSRGVDPARITVIPNGATLRARPPARTWRVGLIGRVVPVKDVCCFLDACLLVHDAEPRARFVVAGPLDHDPAYVERCLEHRDALGLDEVVTFTGTVDGAALAAELDVVVLTSRSEGAPLALLEAMAAGTPVVATDVGGCREVVGAGGLVTPVGSPRATADAILRLLEASTWERASRAARSIASHRTPATMVGAYRELYRRLAG